MPTAELKLYEPYSDIKGELATMEVKNRSLVFDYKSSAGISDAKSHIRQLRAVCGRIESTRKDLKRESTDYGKMIQSAAKELDGRVREMIALHQTPLDEIAEAEADRKAAIQQAIDDIAGGVFADDYNAIAGEWREEIAILEDIEITAERFQERMAEATTLKRDTLEFMRARLALREKHDQEQAELERLRAEKEARDKKDREDKIAADAADKAKREAEERAEADRIEAERKVQAERDASAKREADLKAKAAKDKADADRRVKEAEEAAERKAQAERDAQAKREADAKHVAKIKKEVVAGIRAALGIDDTDASRLVAAIANGDIPHVTITF